ncbi:folate-binding protein YgfZ [Neiella sp. HB171785]|uniref:Folate-binding protein YgfZ n=1 Tax=Neiella litorisoli TaxID=2771431 RepID=A0A8J6QRB8_9GAMM|nr:folate-binding protein YgfZ [Neiella litorisoli]MBD1389991.1 folate-binding protein YgfZ [Neiella litorisoli]
MSKPFLLSDLGVIQVSGADQTSYLQGQLTCDLTKLDEQGWLAGSHCDAKGKMWSNFVMLKSDQGILLVMDKHVLSASLSALQKFGVFAKVDITDASDSLYIYGDLDQTTETPAIAKAQLPFGCLWLSAELVDHETETTDWTVQQIKAGWPLLANAEQVSEFVPQMLNQADIGAISFKKGCYIGQETVARMQYLGKQKRATFYLTGEAPSEALGDIEVNRNGNWRKAGTIINAATDSQNQLHLLAVLASDASAEQQYRLSQAPQTPLQIQDLPYTPAQAAE